MSIPTPTGLSATLGARTVDLTWQPVSFSPGLKDPAVAVIRDGSSIATLAGTATSYQDGDVTTGQSHTYYLVASATFGPHQISSPPSLSVTVTVPGYLVGAATADITPGGVVNQGGFGLGDGSVIPQQVVGRGGQNRSTGEHIMARAIVISDGIETIAIADIETQGYFAAYQEGPWGLYDMAQQVESDLGEALPADNILIASDHTHSGPDTIGVWGGMRAVPVPGYEGPNAYFKWVKDQTVKAIEDAFSNRRFATIRAGHSDASDLIYNQSCSEALNQSKNPTYPRGFPEICATPGKDGMVRVVQATAPSGEVIATHMAFAAHATLGGGGGLHGDWPQFISEALGGGYSRTVGEVTYSVPGYGGVGIAMEGAVGSTQPCRPACAHTDPSNPGYNVDDRRTAYTLNYMAHVQKALDSSLEVTGPVRAAKSFIREPIVGPTALALFTAGHKVGAAILRSHEAPWTNANTVRTVVGTMRVGDILFMGIPGEGYHAIGQGVRDAVGAREVIPLGLANDQLGYLISPARYTPIIAAQVAVNDNILFNASPTIGDHVMCADIRLALTLGFTGESPAQCLPYDAQDMFGDPLGAVPVDGFVVP